MASSMRCAAGLVLLWLFGCGAADQAGSLVLQSTVVLPHPLHEISGIGRYGDHLLSIQDERGALFEIDAEGHILNTRKFGPRGDYEDLAVVGATIFVLRSDGLLLEVVDGMPPQLVATTDIGLAGKEYESLAYDGRRARLLFAPKVDAKAVGDRREIFAFDLASRQVQREPALVLSLAAVEAKAQQQGVVRPRPTTDKGGGRTRLSLRISALAIQPGTDRLWVLSSADHLLLEVAFDGTILQVIGLAADELPKPEGMCFLAADRLCIASEGDGGPGKLCTFGLRAGP